MKTLLLDGESFADAGLRAARDRAAEIGEDAARGYCYAAGYTAMLVGCSRACPAPLTSWAADWNAGYDEAATRFADAADAAHATAEA